MARATSRRPGSPRCGGCSTSRAGWRSRWCAATRTSASDARSSPASARRCRVSDAAIVFEDDLVCVPGTHAWLCAALEHYRDTTRVSSVSAWNHPRLTPSDVGDRPYFSGRGEIWGWGTWRARLARHGPDRARACSSSAGTAASIRTATAPTCRCSRRSSPIATSGRCASSWRRCSRALSRCARRGAWSRTSASARARPTRASIPAGRTVVWSRARRIPTEWPEPVEHPRGTGAVPARVRREARRARAHLGAHPPLDGAMGAARGRAAGPMSARTAVRLSCCRRSCGTACARCATRDARPSTRSRPADGATPRVTPAGTSRRWRSHSASVCRAFSSRSTARARSASRTSRTRSGATTSPRTTSSASYGWRGRARGAHA